MKRLIDADRLKEVVHRNTVGDLFDQFVDMQPTVKAISLDEVKKAREEIEQLKPNNPNYKWYKGETIAINKVLEILDKLIESEV
jgi:chaperonin cofactor prefoldin